MEARGEGGAFEGVRRGVGEEAGTGDGVAVADFCYGV